MRPTEMPRVRDSHVAALSALADEIDTHPDRWSMRATGVSRDDWARQLRHEARVVRVASLWWVSPEMTVLALDASRSLPDWSPGDAAPDDVGVLWWDGDLPDAPYDGAPRSSWPVGALGVARAPEAPVRGVKWRRVGAGIEIQALVLTVDLPDVWSIPVGEVVGSTGAMVGLAVGSTRIVDDDGNPTGVDRSWMEGFVALVGATWLLMREPCVSDTGRVDVRRPGAGRGARRGPVPVATITLRPALRPARERDPDEEPRWRLTRRHLVRGHWRHQPVGEGAAGRELRWVHAYLKGPDGAPISAMEHVRTWRR